MDPSINIKNLFLSVLNKEQSKFKIKAEELKKPYDTMAKAYGEDKEWKKNEGRKEVDYNAAALRCAYLHKYAMIHTSLVFEIFDTATKIFSIKESFQEKVPLKICSLGGGPGSDIVGLVFVLEELFRETKYDISVVDVSKSWKSVFEFVISELKSRLIVTNPMIKGGSFQHKYLQADLLKWEFIDPSVQEAILDADVITMVKFVSAAACSKTEDMMKNICSSMKHGALLLFIDNAGGGFRESMEGVAKHCHLELLFNENHYKCNFENLNCELKGKRSQYQAIVCASVWRKPLQVSDTVDGPQQEPHLQQHDEDDQEPLSCWRCCLIM